MCGNISAWVVIRIRALITQISNQSSIDSIGVELIGLPSALDEGMKLIE